MTASIEPVRTPEALEHVRTLMRHYNAFLGKLGVDLCFQDFNLELEALPGKYVLPLGELWLARDAFGNALGCIAVKPLGDNTTCEMKRLWVEDAAKGTGIGRTLAITSIDFARKVGYQAMKLDTLRNRMPAAIALYESLGFVETEAYVHNPECDVLYMKLAL